MSGERGLSGPLSTYATLVRLPNLFTVPPDIVLGAVLAVGAGRAVSDNAVVGLAVASVVLYAAGTTLNDYFDASEDARERPERPIPSGDVSRNRALVLGIVLLIAGVVTAFRVAGPIAGAVAGALALTILVYDGVFKGSAIGFVTMGVTRGLNVLLGVTAARSPTSLPLWAVVVPVTVTIFIAGVTHMAESETRKSDQRVVLPAIGGVAAAALGVVGLIILRSTPLLNVAFALLVLAGFLGWTGRALRSAYKTPIPETIGPAVGACVLGLTALDAAFAATIEPVPALVALAFVAPAVGLSRVVSVS